MKLARLKKIGMKIALTLTLASTIAMPINAIDFMKVSDVQRGMHGIAKTVEQGDDITTFDVKVLGIMKDRGPSGDLILAEFSGPVIERSGGIAHGMSGSPVYIDGKLVGAVAYGWGFTRSKIGMITPIEQMVNLWDISYSKDKPNPWSNTSDFMPLGTPFMASGFEPAALDYLKEKLPQYKFDAYDTASGSNDEQAKPLKDGSSVAATIVDGDLKLGAIGTVTYADDDKIVAFGHPYLKEGKADYFMHNAYILAIVNSQESSFKLGSIGANVGTITEDRGAGIAGVVGKEPKFIPMNISITDTDMGKRKDAYVKLVRDNTLTPSLASTSVYSFLTKTMDRKGGGTSTIKYKIKTADKNLKDFERSDMFYSGNSIALKSIDELYDVMDRLMNNSFVDYDVDGIEVDVDVAKARKTAQILDATANPIIVSPGDTIHVSVNLHPYDGEDITKELVFKVPENQSIGPMTLEVRGGGETPLPYLIQQQKLNLTAEVVRRLHVYKDFETYFKRIENMDKNNQIIVEVLDNDVSMVDNSKISKTAAKLTSLGNEPSEGVKLKKGPARTDWDAFDGDKNRAILETGYIVKGDGQFNIRVLPPKERDEAIKELIAKRRKEAKEKERLEKEHKPTLREKLLEAKIKISEESKEKEKKRKEAQETNEKQENNKNSTAKK